MNTPSRQIHIQALVDEDIEENLISQLFAVRHGLEMGPLHEAEEGTEECIGAVVIPRTMESGEGKSEVIFNSMSSLGTQGARRYIRDEVCQ